MQFIRRTKNMSESLELQRAKMVYSSIVNMFESKKWTFDEFEDDLVIRSGFRGDDLPINFLMLVKPDRQVVQFISKLQFNMPEDKIVEGAIAVSIANYNLVDGSFDYNISNGEIRYRLTSSYLNSNLSEDVFEYMIMCGAGTVDKYNSRFYMLAKGVIDIEKFFELEND